MKFITFCRSLLPNDKPNLNNIVLQNESALTQKLDIGMQKTQTFVWKNTFTLK